MATLIWVAMWSGIAFMAAAVLYAAYLILRLGYSLVEVINEFKLL